MKYKFFIGLPIIIALSGCSSLLAAKAQQFGENFSETVLQSNDPILVQEALPAYLLLLDALIKNQPQNAALLQAAATLNSAYAGAFVVDSARARLLTEKAFAYINTALCQQHKKLCGLQQIPIEEMNARIASMSMKELASLYTLGSIWAAWIQVHSDDWNAVADLARVRLIMERVIALNENYQQGEAHLYLGVLASLLAPALGGQPEVGKVHFEKALTLSAQKNLMVKVYYAKYYARNTLNRELHDTLLNEVLAENPQAGRFTLGNLLAQQQAKTLLASADEYF